MENERSLRLKKLLGAALQPMTEQLETLEQEVASLRKKQEKLIEIIEKNLN